MASVLPGDRGRMSTVPEDPFCHCSPHPRVAGTGLPAHGCVAPTLHHARVRRLVWAVCQGAITHAVVSLCLPPRARGAFPLRGCEHLSPFLLRVHRGAACWISGDVWLLSVAAPGPQPRHWHGLWHHSLAGTWSLLSPLCSYGPVGVNHAVGLTDIF